jgi:DNA-binding CsgD family transcriptional regulator
MDISNTTAADPDEALASGRPSGLLHCTLSRDNPTRRIFGNSRPSRRAVTVADRVGRRYAAASPGDLEPDPPDQTVPVPSLPLVAELGLLGGRADSAAQLREAAQIALQAGLSLTTLNALYACGYLCAATGRPADAITAWVVKETLDRQAGAVLADTETHRQEKARCRTRQELRPDRARAAEQRGMAMSPTAPGPPAPAAPGTARLSAREQELVALVAQGRTDAQIAAQLFISICTVRSHLDRIRDKTGYRRRADLTRLALIEGLA